MPDNPFRQSVEETLKEGNPFRREVDRGGSEPRSFMDAFTGSERGRGTLPEFGGVDVGDTAAEARMGLGFFTTPDIEARKDIIRKNVPGVSFQEDEHGNTVVELPDGRRAFLNAPGLSLQDFTDLGSEIVKFLPAAKIAGMPSTIPRRVGLGFLAGGATSVTEDVAAQPQGSEQGVDLPRAGLSAGLQGGAELIAPMASGAARFFSNRVLRRQAQQPQELIPKTQGQRTGDPRQLAREERLRARTDKAGELIRGFDERQQQQLRTIVDDVQEELARTGRSPVIATEREGGELISEEIGEAGETMLLQIDDAFNQAARFQATVPREGLNLLGNIRQRLINQGYTIDREVFPATARSLEKLENLRPRTETVDTGILSASGRPVQKQVERGISSQTLEELNTTRKAINKFIDSAQSNPADKLGATLVKKELDSFIDDVFDYALFEGDEQALEALKKARGLRAEFGKRFERRDVTTTSGRKVRDEAGALLESIVQKQPTDEQVVNSIFGASQLFSKKTAANVVKRLREAIDDPTRLDSVLKQIVLRRLTRPAMRDGGFMPNRFARAFDETMNSNESLMRTIFTKDELGAIRQFRNESLQTARQGGPLNTNEFSDKLIRSLGRLGTVLGLQRGGIGFGAVGGSFGRGIGKTIRGRTALTEARQAIGEQTLPGRPNNKIIATSVAAARQALGEEGQQEIEDATGAR